MANATKGGAVSTPNQLLAAVLAGDWDAADAAPLRVWHEAQSIANGYHHAQYCAMLRFDNVARDAQLQLSMKWSAIAECASWLDWQADNG